MDRPNGPLRDELRRLARAAEGGLLSVEIAASALGASSRAAALRLGALARSGWVTRARRGLYFVPPMDSGASPVAEDSILLADALYAPCYIGGWSAAEHWGLTEQLFDETFVATAASLRARHQTALGARFRLAKVSVARVESVPRLWRRRVHVRISSPERTIADGCLDPSWVGGIRHLGQILNEYRGLKSATPNRLVQALREVDKGAAWKRAGLLVEHLWPEATHLVDTALASRSAGMVRLDPAVAERGRMNRRWGLWVNASVASRHDTT